MVLYKRTFRELVSEKGRYIALFLLVVFGVALSVGVAASSDSILNTIKKEYQKANAEDGEFSVFAPLSDSDISSLEEKGAKTEKNFYLDFSAAKSSTLRVFVKRSSINKLVLDKGREPLLISEIALEKNYAESHGYSVGKTISMGGKTFTVCGTGSVPDYNLSKANISDVNSDSSKFGVAFVTSQAYENLLNSGKASKMEEYGYAYKLSGGLTDKQLKNDLKKIKVDTSMLSGSAAASGVSASNYAGTDNLLSFTAAKDNSRISAYSEDTGSMKAEAIMVGIIFIALLSYIISVFTIYGIEKDSTAIGTLYSMGYDKKELIRVYILLPVLVIAAGGIVGAAAGFALIGPLSQQDIVYYSFPALEKTVSPYLLIYGIVMPILIAAVINYLVIRKNLAKDPLALLRNERKHGRISRLKLRRFKFLTKFRIRQFMREIVSNVSIAVGLFIALLIMLFGFTVYGAINNFSVNGTKDIKWDYMYLLKYPMQNAPENAEKAYTMGLKAYYPDGGTDISVTLLGIKSKSGYFGFSIGEGKHDLCFFVSRFKIRLEKRSEGKTFG